MASLSARAVAFWGLLVVLAPASDLRQGYGQSAEASAKAEASTADPQQSTDNDIPYQASRLIGRWRTVMNTTLEESRAFAAEEVTDEMEVFVSPGAVRAVREKAPETVLKKADAALVEFVHAMIKAGTRQPDGSVVVESSAIEPAERAICPVYPFCD